MKERLSENRPREFENEYCKFRPFEWQEVDGLLRPILFKVVTSDLKSLGLRRNPNIIQYSVGEWITLSDDETQAGITDWGGIWSVLRLSRAKTLTKYMFEKYSVVTRTFWIAVDSPLFANDYRVKSQGVIFLEEMDKNLFQ
jgi:hypothetical protein